MIAVLANARLESVVLVQDAGKLALSVLGQAFLLFKDIAKLFVFALQHLILPTHFREQHGIGCMCRVLVILFRDCDGIFALLFGLLEDVQFSLSHGKLYSHAACGLLALHYSHVVL